MVWCALGYALIGSGLTWLVGRPLIALNGERYAREAEFRFALVRVNESGESIALHGGEISRQSLKGSKRTCLRERGVMSIPYVAKLNQHSDHCQYDRDGLAAVEAKRRYKDAGWSARSDVSSADTAAMIAA